MGPSPWDGRLGARVGGRSRTAARGQGRKRPLNARRSSLRTQDGRRREEQGRRDRNRSTCLSAPPRRSVTPCAVSCLLQALRSLKIDAAEAGGEPRTQAHMGHGDARRDKQPCTVQRSVPVGARDGELGVGALAQPAGDVLVDDEGDAGAGQDADRRGPEAAVEGAQALVAPRAADAVADVAVRVRPAGLVLQPRADRLIPAPSDSAQHRATHGYVQAVEKSLALPLRTMYSRLLSGSASYSPPSVVSPRLRRFRSRVRRLSSS